MDVAVVLLVLILVITTIAAVGAWRRTSTSTLSRDDLGAGERRLLDSVQRLRDSLDATMRDAAQDAGKAQRELATSLTGMVERLGGDIQRTTVDRFLTVEKRLTDGISEARKEQTQALLSQRKALEDNREAQVSGLADVQAAVRSALDAMREAQAVAFNGLQERVQTRLDELRKDNEGKLEKIRSTVEEKLQSTLETRLGESFRQVSDQLEQVYKGLGEMRTLATGVGDLKRVLTNVRSRGTFGEVQLAALLEQFFSPEQYACNVATVPGSSERVEFAVKLPGRDDTSAVVFLPIDAKFPQEDYQRLQQAFDEGNAAAADEARKALRQRALLEARTIQEKYLAPPETTDFALLYLPTEGLYAEILRIPGLADEMQRRCRVIPVGPTNLYALLNSLQMGFRTLAIEKRSGEVWRILGAVKTEFAKFGESLDAVSKKLQEAGNKIEDAARRSRAVERKLREVEGLPEAEAARLLPGGESSADDDGEPPALEQPADR